MCGIAGAFGRDAPDEARLRATLAALHQRGPDAEGRMQGPLGGQPLTLLHTRLSIIDLEPRANQPMRRGPLAVVYNGEIYNYREVRADLEAKGERFATQSDTEVLLAAWQAWGAAALDRLEGMWAFALADFAAGTLTLARDRFGEKPLYHAWRDGTLYFASETRALAAVMGAAFVPDPAQVKRFLVNGYKALYKQPATFFQDVHELPAGSRATLAAPAWPAPCRYWRLAFRPRRMSLAEAEEGFRERLLQAVALRLRADVPIAFCLSGGVDSGALAAVAQRLHGQRIHTFSILDKDERYDERDNIRTTASALGCAHHEIETSTDGFLDRLAAQVAHHDAPVATISYYVHALLSQAIHAAGYKVAISGTAADELVTGYYDHYGFWLAEMAGRADFPALLEDWRQSYGRYVQNPLLRDPLRFRDHPQERGHVYLNRATFNALLLEPLAEDFVEARFCDNLLRNRMLNELMQESVPVILHEDDRNSMRWSVENRSPYLDRALAEFAYSIPAEHLIQHGYAKWPLRAAVAGLLPDPVRLDKRKRGLNVNIDAALDRGDATVRERLLSPSPIFELVDRAAFERFLAADMHDNSFSKFLFGFVSAKLFLEHAAGAAQGRLAA